MENLKGLCTYKADTIRLLKDEVSKAAQDMKVLQNAELAKLKELQDVKENVLGQLEVMETSEEALDLELAKLDSEIQAIKEEKSKQTKLQQDKLKSLKL